MKDHRGRPVLKSTERFFQEQRKLLALSVLLQLWSWVGAIWCWANIPLSMCSGALHGLLLVYAALLTASFLAQLPTERRNLREILEASADVVELRRQRGKDPINDLEDP